jgi:hypothetical protein
MIEKIEQVIFDGLKEGYDLDTIHEYFMQAINKHSPRNTYTKKTKKKQRKPKKICRPVLLISDSSCDEFNGR